MNIIYLGLLYSDTFLQTKSQYTNNGLQMATHNFQKNLLTGLKSKENIKGLWQSQSLSSDLNNHAPKEVERIRSKIV